jgi:hypothetical protein
MKRVGCYTHHTWGASGARLHSSAGGSRIASHRIVLHFACKAAASGAHAPATHSPHRRRGQWQRDTAGASAAPLLLLLLLLLLLHLCPLLLHLCLLLL